MAGESLRDQLLKAGLVDKKKAKKSQQQQKQANTKARKAAKSGKKPLPSEDQQQRIKQVMREKHQRDLELNKARDADKAKQAQHAELFQILNQHRISLPEDAEIAYHFTYQNKVKRLYVTNEIQQQLIAAQLLIAVIDDRSYVIPEAVAEKIESRLPDSVVRAENNDGESSDDPYADYAVPDDLIW